MIYRCLPQSSFGKKSTTDSYCFQDLMFIKSLETNTLQLSATKKIELKLNNTEEE